MVNKKILLSSVIAAMMGYSLSSYADDTEVYFSAIVNNLKANVLFAIDVSGSMNFKVESDVAATGVARESNRMATIKNSLQEILNDEGTQNLRIGLMSFADEGYITLRQPIVDIDEIDTDKDIKKTVSGADTTLEQTILTDSDDGWQGFGKVQYGPDKPTWVINKQMNDTSYWSLNNSLGNQITQNKMLLSKDQKYASHIGLRFNNILLKKPSSVSLSTTAIKQATLKFYGYSKTNTKIPVAIDLTANSPYLRPEIDNSISNRPQSSIAYCDVGKVLAWYSCDLTSQIQTIVGNAEWQDGNAITVIMMNPKDAANADWIMVYFRESGLTAKLEITADSNLIAKNKKRNSEKILDAAMSLFPQGDTAIVSTLYQASGYISNINDKTSNPGPYHFTNYPTSPITDRCQLSHIVLMTDGTPAGESIRTADTVSSYINQGAGGNCRIFTGNDTSTTITDPGSGAYSCGRALSSWMARVSQSKITGEDGNFIRTQTIAFALNDASGVSFLKDLALYGQGEYYPSTNAKELIEAFKSIIEMALGAARPSASGVVSMGAQSNYDQRSEVFYGLYTTNSYDYWSGNVKGFKMGFDDYELGDDKKAQKAVLKDWSGNNYVVAKDGTFIDNFSSAWSTKDSGEVTKGGIIGHLDKPDTRKLYTLKADTGTLNSDSAITLSSDASISATDLGLTGADNTEGRRKGLLDFIRGYDYIDGGVTNPKVTVANPKIGESANNGVALLSYGNCGDKNILSCDYDTLQMVGFYATNDGFFRGYDLTNGKALYEFIPQQILPIINQLQKRKILNQKSVKTYGLDSRVVIAHDDVNKNGIIDGTEKAYAIVETGRGGSYDTGDNQSFIYAVDITIKSSPKLVWVIENKGSFSQLGKTWSVPVVGKINVGGTAKSVLVFGGGYDTRQDGDSNYDGTTVPQLIDTVGNALYVVDVQTGQLLWSTSTGMQYSIPGQVATLTNEDGLITDVFAGDMGGQIWRFVVNNGQTGGNLLKAGNAKNGLVAKISGTGKSDTRRFYQTPMLYKIPDSNIVTLNVGTGYKAHPLVKGNEDRFYSLRFPLQADLASNDIIEEDDLGELDPMNTADGPSNIEHGFMLKLDKDKGEKVISNAFADFDRLIFSTYLPDTGSINDQSCVVNKVGTQRTYYFALASGKSLLETGYTEVYPATLPLDSVAYCNKDYCSVISSMDMLAKEAKVPDASIIERNKGGAAKKTTWTDLFNADVK